MYFSLTPNKYTPIINEHNLEAEDGLLWYSTSWEFKVKMEDLIPQRRGGHYVQEDSISLTLEGVSI